MKLLSVGKLTDYNCSVLFTPTSCIVQDHTERMIGAGRKVNSLVSSSFFITTSRSEPLRHLPLWHHRLGHLSTFRLKILSDSDVLEKFQFSNSNNCKGYRFAKQVVLFGSGNYMALKIFDLIHSDILGPALISSLSGYNYYVYFVDNCS